MTALSGLSLKDGANLSAAETAPPSIVRGKEIVRTANSISIDKIEVWVCPAPMPAKLQARFDDVVASLWRFLRTF
jgi:hypothetical protein